MNSEKRPSEQGGGGEPARDVGVRGSGTARLSPTHTRAIVEQLLRHGRELGRREMLDLPGARQGGEREEPGPDAPTPENLGS